MFLRIGVLTRTRTVGRAVDDRVVCGVDLAIFLAACSSPGLRSGWYFLASLRARLGDLVFEAPA